MRAVVGNLRLLSQTANRLQFRLSNAEDAYARVRKKPNQVPLQAHLVAELSDNRVVVMLEALPPSEAEFDRKENHCIKLTDKSRQLQAEIEEQFAFVGGTHAEYCKYFRRSDLPNNMWTWRSFADVKAIAGFSCVPKNGITQRKLLISCSFIFLLSDIEARSRLGMTGCRGPLEIASGAAGSAGCRV